MPRHVLHFQAAVVSALSTPAFQAGSLGGNPSSGSNCPGVPRVQAPAASNDTSSPTLETLQAARGYDFRGQPEGWGPVLHTVPVGRDTLWLHHFADDAAGTASGL